MGLSINWTDFVSVISHNFVNTKLDKVDENGFSIFFVVSGFRKGHIRT
jgi:hypothetical protein